MFKNQFCHKTYIKVFNIISQAAASAALHQVPNIVAEHSDEFMSTLQEINRDIQDVSKKLAKTESEDSFKDEKDDDDGQNNEDSLISKEEERFK